MLGGGQRVTVDASAHVLPAMLLWPGDNRTSTSGVVVFDHWALSLIKAKQGQRSTTAGVALDSIDRTAVAASVGISGYAVDTLGALGATTNPAEPAWNPDHGPSQRARTVAPGGVDRFVRLGFRVAHRRL